MSIRKNLERIRELIRDSELKTGRPDNSVTLVAVSKFHPVTAVIEAVEAGQFVFGENRVQEALDKFPQILSQHPQVELHLIGSLQRNKVAKVLPVSSCIQSVDRIDLLLEIGKRAVLIGKNMTVLFEMHTGEESKAGFLSVDDLFRALDTLREYPNVHCAGLMTMAPFTDNDREIRASFRKLKQIQETCIRAYPQLDFSVLSMGMSNDYRIAIEEGSTMVRIGTAIFGERQT